MPDPQTILNGEAVTLARVKVGRWVGDGTYDNVTQAYGSDTFTVTLTGVSAERVADGGKRVASYGALTGATISFTFAGDWTALSVLIGAMTYTSGTTPERIRVLQGKNGPTPYFGLIASMHTNAGERDAVQFFAPKCMLTPDSIEILSMTGNAEASFGTVTLEAMIVEDENYSIAGQNTIQEVLVTGATEGTYGFMRQNVNTSNLAFDAVDTAVETAINALPSVGTGGVDVTTIVGGFEVEFSGPTVAQKSQPPLYPFTDDDFDGTVTVSRTQIGYEAEFLSFTAYELEGAYELELPPVYPVSPIPN